MASSTCGAFENSSPYVLKPQAHSSHSILLELVPENGNGRRLLDVGCADGYLSQRFADRGFSVTAIDAPGPQQRVMPHGIRYLEADLDGGLPLSEVNFDFVVCADILEHLRDPESILRQIRSQIAERGKLIASLPNSGNIYFRLNVLFGRFPAHDRGLFDRTHLHFYTWEGWSSLLERNGFRITTTRTSVMPFSLFWPRLTRWTAALESLNALAARAWSKLFAYQFIVVAEDQSG
jgi:SAM-dependent methyltransferase